MAFIYQTVFDQAAPSAVVELNDDEILAVSGGDRGDATVGGMFAGAAAGYRVFQGAS